MLEKVNLGLDVVFGLTILLMILTAAGVINLGWWIPLVPFGLWLVVWLIAKLINKLRTK